MTYSKRMQRFIKWKQKGYNNRLNQFKGKKRNEIIESALKQKCEDRKVNEILEHFGYDKLSVDKREKYYGICMCSDMRKNRGYRYSRADNLSRN